MKVKELIAELEKVNGDFEVLTGEAVFNVVVGVAVLTDDDEGDDGCVELLYKRV